MGAQASGHCTVQTLLPSAENMAPMKAMKAMKAKKAVTSMSKGAIAEKLAAETGLKKSQCSKVMGVLADVAQTQVKKAGKFVVPGVCMVKTRVKPATKAGKRMMFGKEVVVKARPAKTVVKAFAVATLKKSI